MEPTFFDAHVHEIEMDDEDWSPPVSPATKACAQTTKAPNCPKLRQLFRWLPVDAIKNTFQNATQLAWISAGTLLKKHCKAQKLALNVIRCGEPAAADELFSNTPAVDSGAWRKTGIPSVGI